MVRSDRATTLDGVFALHPALASRASKWTALFDPITTAPLVFRDPQSLRFLNPTPSQPNEVVKQETSSEKRFTPKPETDYRKPIFCLGDAAAFIDPFVGDGISLALRTGVAAAESVLLYIRREQSLPASAAAYAERYQRDFAPILKSASRVRRLLDTPRALRAAALSAMRLPFVANYVIRKTRSA
jgi:2-polyprenyl-6-methoxyphenol hydroxylase-like FAD-dependent oxidoreductase